MADSLGEGLAGRAQDASADGASRSASNLDSSSTQRSHWDNHGNSNNASLNEHFATSRQEFDFNGDEEDLSDDDGQPLEPAPVIKDFDGDLDDEELRDDDTELQALLHATNDSVDYYTLLGLSKESEPTTAQIRSAYHRLSLAFHPDKHPHHRRAAAEKYFTKLQRAYEVLIEPRKRTIYDLQGEDGVQAEYQTGGIMSNNTERRIGVKTMSAEEFRAYFIGILRTRERRSLEELVGASGSVKITLDGQRLFEPAMPMQAESPLDASKVVEVYVPVLRLEQFKLAQTFNVQLPAFGKLLRHPRREVLAVVTGNSGNDERDDGRNEQISIPRVTFAAGIDGLIRQTLVMIRTEDRQKAPLDLVVDRHIRLETDNLSLGAGIEYVLPDTTATNKPNLIASTIAGTSIELTTAILAKRSVSIGLGRAVPLLGHTQPAYGYMRTTLDQSLFWKPPRIDIRVSRAISRTQLTYLDYSTGDFRWPDWSSGLLPVVSGPSPATMLTNPSSMRLGWSWSETPGGTTVDADEADAAEEVSDAERDNVSQSNATWHMASTATTNDLSFTITYGRDLLMSKALPPMRSRFMQDGNPMPASKAKLESAPRGIRLQIEGDLSITGSLSGMVRGLRRVGNFATIGFGIGLGLSKGLFLSLSWRRLGQSVSVPIVIAAPENITTPMFACALAAPWMTYAAIEFVVVRPLARRKRTRLIEAKRKELSALVVRRRQEAEEAVALMRPLVEYKQALELEQSGLVIVRATFGVPTRVETTSSILSRCGAPSFTSEVADVTIALASFIDNSQVNIPRGVNKGQLAGFWDPAPMRKKILAVKYFFNGKEHYTEIKASAALRLPQRGHEVQESAVG